MKLLSKCFVFILLAAPLAAADDVNWPRWRGPDNTGSTNIGNYPVEWGPQDLLWEIEIPGKGCSTPIVWNKTIYLTTGQDDSDTVFALDWSGKEIWKKKLGAETAGKHRNGSGSNPSATTDGSAVFVCFKSGNFAALELDGAVRWKTNLFERYGKDDRYWDFGSSPALTKRDVVIAEMHDGESWLAAFDKITGELSWKVPRNYKTPKEGSQGYTTPLVFSHNGIEALLVWGGQTLSAHNAEDGKIIWSCGDFNPKGTAQWPAVASPVISGSVAVVPCGRADRNMPRLHGIKMGGSGDVTDTHRLWKRMDTGPFVPSPGAYEGRVYIIRDHGEVDCINPLTGENIWSGVLPKGKSKGNFYSSPLIAGGHLYAVRESGIIYVMKLGDKFDLISEIDMEIDKTDRIIASPIAIDDRLLFRTYSRLFCVGSK